MAGVAPSQRGGSNATTMGMIVAIVVAVILAGVLIWLYTMQEGLRSNADAANVAKEKVASSADVATAQKLFPNAAGGSKSLVGEINKSVQLLMARMTGNQNENVQEAVKKLDATLEKFAADGKIANAEQISPSYGAVTLLDNLYQMYVGEKQARSTAEAALDKAKRDLDKSLATNSDLKSKYDADLGKLAAKVEEIQRAKSEHETTKNTEIQALAGEIQSKGEQLNSMRKETAKERDSYRSTLDKQNSLLEQQRVALRDLRGPAPTNAQPLAVARKAIGKIIRALPGDSLLHINLGRDDNVVLGMTFSVYSASDQVPATGRGKASIEVVSVGQYTSECKITSPASPDDPILEGDSVGNVILSKNREKKQRFCVIGEFDVDFDGKADVRGRDNIVALIERWGGVVVDRVDPMTDYVVVGLEPPVAETPRPVAKPVVKEKPAKAEVKPKAKPEKEDSDEASDDESGDDKSADDDSGDEDKSDKADADKEEPGDKEPADEDDDTPKDKKTDEKPVTTTAKAEEKPIAPAPVSAPTSGLQIDRNPEVDPTLGPVMRHYRNERERYDDALLRANTFSIPVLPQDHFFNFIGIEGTVSDARRIQG